MGDLSWVDDWFPSVDGIRAKAAREEIAEKGWVTIHGHPVLIGGGGGGGGGGKGGGGGHASSAGGAGGGASGLSQEHKNRAADLHDQVSAHRMSNKKHEAAINAIADEAGVHPSIVRAHGFETALNRKPLASWETAGSRAKLIKTAHEDAAGEADRNYAQRNQLARTTSDASTRAEPRPKAKK